MAVSVEFSLEEITANALRQQNVIADFCHKVEQASEDALYNSTEASPTTVTRLKTARAWLGFYNALPDIIINARHRAAINLTISYNIDEKNSCLTIDCFDDGLILPKVNWFKPVANNPDILFDYYDLLSGKIKCWEHAPTQNKSYHQAALLMTDDYYEQLALVVALIGNRAGDSGSVAVKAIDGEGMLLRISSADMLANDTQTKERCTALSQKFATAAACKSAWIKIIESYRHGEP